VGIEGNAEGNKKIQIRSISAREAHSRFKKGEGEKGRIIIENQKQRRPDWTGGSSIYQREKRAKNKSDKEELGSKLVMRRIEVESGGKRGRKIENQMEGD